MISVQQQILQIFAAVLPPRVWHARQVKPPLPKSEMALINSGN